MNSHESLETPGLGQTENTMLSLALNGLNELTSGLKRIDAMIKAASSREVPDEEELEEFYVIRDELTKMRSYFVSARARLQSMTVEANSLATDSFEMDLEPEQVPPAL